MAATSLALHTALVEHDLDRTRALLSQGADPNAPNEDGWRPLHVAVGELGVGGAVEFVKTLIEHGADVNGWDTNRNDTPILTASNPPEVEAARLLLEEGADPNVANSEGETPLRWCVEQGSLEMARLLLRYGAADAIDKWGGINGLTVLGIAARRFNIPMIELLLDAGADPEATDEYGETARDHLPPREEHDPQAWDRVIELLGRRRR